MYTEEQIRRLDGDGLTDLIDNLSKRDLEEVFCGLVGAAPGAVAISLNLIERVKAIRAARLAREAKAQCADCDQPLDGRELQCISAGCPSRDAAVLSASTDAGAPVVITDSGRDCDQAHPESGAWCHKSGPHNEHRDTDGALWTTEPAAVSA